MGYREEHPHLISEVLQTDVIHGGLLACIQGDWQALYRLELSEAGRFELWSLLLDADTADARPIGKGLTRGPTYHYRPSLLPQRRKRQIAYRYRRFGVANRERPLVFHREYGRDFEDRMEIDQEFCLFHNLYEDHDRGIFLAVGEDDQPLEVIRMTEREVQVSRSHLAKYQKALGLSLVVHIRSTRLLQLPWEALNHDELVCADYDAHVQWERRIRRTSEEDGRVFSELCGKAVLDVADHSWLGGQWCAPDTAQAAASSYGRIDKEPRRKCPHCGDESRQVKVGYTEARSQRYRCRACNRSYTPKPKSHAYPETVHAIVHDLYEAGLSLGDIGLATGTHPTTVLRWITQRAKDAGVPACPVANHTSDAPHYTADTEADNYGEP